MSKKISQYDLQFLNSLNSPLISTDPNGDGCQELVQLKGSLKMMGDAMHSVMIKHDTLEPYLSRVVELHEDSTKLVDEINKYLSEAEHAVSETVCAMGSIAELLDKTRDDAYVNSNNMRALLMPLARQLAHVENLLRGLKYPRCA